MSKYAGSLQLKSLKSDQSGFVLKSPLQGSCHRYYNIINKRTITTWSVQTVDKFEKSSLPAVFSWKIVRSLISEIHSLSVLDHCYSLSLQNRWLPLQALAFRCGVSLGRALPAGVPHTHSNQLCFILDGTSFVSIEASCIFKTSKELDFIKQ